MKRDHTVSSSEKVREATEAQSHAEFVPAVMVEAMNQ